jgi:hypothetical protein
MNQLACAFQQCSPLDPKTTTVKKRLETLTGNINTPFRNPDLPNHQEQWDDYIRGKDDFFNLPSTVIFPALAKDVVAAINFAKDNGLEISVKTSGNVSIDSSLFTLYISQTHELCPLIAVLHRCFHKEKYSSFEHEQEIP